MLPSQQIQLPASSTDRQPTIASCRQRLSSEKKLSSISINTSVSYHDFTANRACQQPLSSIKNSLSKQGTTPDRQISQPAISQLITAYATSASAASISNEELSSRIADSFQQFSHMLAALSCDTGGRSNSGNNPQTNAKSLFESTIGPVTPPGNMQNEDTTTSHADYIYTSNLPVDRSSLSNQMCNEAPLPMLSKRAEQQCSADGRHAKRKHGKEANTDLFKKKQKRKENVLCLSSFISITRVKVGDSELRFF